MRRTNLILGILLLLVAAAVAVYTTGSPEGFESASSTAPHSKQTGDLLRGQIGPHGTTLPASTAKSYRLFPAEEPVLETLHIEPFGPTHPALEAQAERVERGARSRLEEMTGELALTPRQQVEIFPLLARSHPDYSDSLRILGVPSGGLIDPLGKLAADQKIHELLDPEQQLDLEISAAATDIWWTDVIARLEKDLVESTKEPAETGPGPEHDPTPPTDDLPQTPAPPPHRGGNLFDRLREDGS